MKRNLIIQMLNEWRDNVWLIVALVIVSLVIWVLSINLWKEIGGAFEPRGFEPEDVYTLRVEVVPVESPEYEDYGDKRVEMEREDRLALMEAIRKSDNVEAAAWSNNATPYEFSFYGSRVFLADGKDTIGYSANFRRASPDIARILRFRSHNGLTAEQLTEKLRQKEILISNSSQDDKSLSPELLYGNKVTDGFNSDKIYRVGDIIDNVRRSDYEIPWGGTVVIPVDDDQPGDMWRIVLRVRPGRGDAFVEEFDNTPSMQQHRNFYLSSLTKLTDRRNTAQASVESQMLLIVSLMAILLVVILLGLLGTFWFRVQQRVQEIAIRKVTGASNGDIFRRIIGEGIILVVISTLLAGIVFWIVFKYANLESIDIFGTPEVMVWAELTTFAIVAVGVALSLWWPARRAMRIEPAIAIKDE